MDSEIGRNLILWTVRVSVACYAWAVWRFVFRRPHCQANNRHFRSAWGLSWLFCVIHVVCAYHFEHHWSQDAALKHTAEMTQRVVGIHWGGGLYVNYLFLTAWGIDVWWLLTKGGFSSRSMQAVAAFMMLNATVVFGPLWWFLPTGIFMAALVWQRRKSVDDTPISPS